MRRRLTASAALACVLVGAAACGRPDTAEPVSVGGPAGAAGAPGATVAPSSTTPTTAGPPTTVGTRSPQGPTSANGPLPTLPPAEQRDPDRYDAQGCTRTGPSSSECASTADQVDATAAGASAADWRTLNGFVGRYFTTDLRRGTLTLLDPTITVTTVGSWRATGLARSERADVVPGVRVTAVLVGADGTVLETVTADSPVAPVRPGEPVPFSLVATTPASAVARVQWAVAPIDAPVTGGRDLELATFWTRATDAGGRVDLYLHHDPAAGPLPHLVYGSATNTGGAVLTQPSVALAWLDDAGRVVTVTTTPVAAPDGGPAASLGPGQAGDFLASVADPAVAAQLAGLTPMLWGMGR